MTYQGIVLERKCRVTGTRVWLEYAPDADPVQPWLTVCEAHGGVCSHETRRVAEQWLSHPDEWCEDCMYGEGTLSGVIVTPMGKGK